MLGPKIFLSQKILVAKKIGIQKNFVSKTILCPKKFGPNKGEVYLGERDSKDVFRLNTNVTRFLMNLYQRNSLFKRQIFL